MTIEELDKMTEEEIVGWAVNKICSPCPPPDSQASKELKNTVHDLVMILLWLGKYRTHKGN